METDDFCRSLKTPGLSTLGCFPPPSAAAPPPHPLLSPSPAQNKRPTMTRCRDLSPPTPCRSLGLRDCPPPLRPPPGPQTGNSTPPLARSERIIPPLARDERIMGAEWFHNGPKRLQEAPKTVQKGSESPNDYSKTPNIVSDGPRNSEYAPESLQEASPGGPKSKQTSNSLRKTYMFSIFAYWAFAAPKTAQEAPNVAPGRPKRPPRLFKTAPKRLQEEPSGGTRTDGEPEQTFRALGPKTRSRKPETPPRSPQEAPLGPQEASKGPQETAKRLQNCFRRPPRSLPRDPISVRMAPHPPPRYAGGWAESQSSFDDLGPQHGKR